MSKVKKSSRILIISAVIAVLLLSSFCVMYNYGFSGLRKIPAADSSQIKVACVGDSITYGHGIKNWSRNNYPKQLQQLLGEEYCVANFGVSGIAAQNSSSRPYSQHKMFAESLEFDADIVVIMLGSNDSKEENWNGVQSFEEQYASLVKSYIDNNPESRVILCSPAQPFAVGGKADGEIKFGIRAEQVLEICGAVQRTAEKYGCEFLDINAFTYSNEQWFEADGVHPDADGAGEIASFIAKAITDTDGR